uniref:Glycosyltransferase n=1 Tax=Indigofera suffruticosa TaxID=100149 RepID=V9SHP7_9FABA|nr:UDP-glucosyltransferase [Indigofera suffruticosa]
MAKKRAQVVFIPSPGAGHFGSTVEFAKLLSNRDEGISITVLVMKSPFDHSTSANSCTESLSSFERIKVTHLPEVQVTADQFNPGSFMTELLELQKPNVTQVVSNLTASASAPPLAAFVVDMFCTTMIDVAEQHFKVPSLVFYTSGLAFLGLILHLHTIRERDNIYFGDSEADVAIPSFVNPVPPKSLPSIVVNKEWNPFFLRYGGGLKRANGLIVNSFEELESHAVRSFSSTSEFHHLPVYPVGPILNFNGGDDADNNNNNEEIIKWLDDQPPSSVVFLCFGSMGSFDEDQVREIAIALDNSGARFLWSLRKPPPKDTMGKPSDYAPSELPAILPDGFLDRTAGIGRIIGWAPQTQILAHPSTGGFVSHCGWNSTLESIYFGVPIAAWPLYAEQQTNAFELVCELKVAVEIALDYRVEFKGGRNMLLSADKIERGIRSVLEKDGEFRNKVKEMSEKSRKTLLPGGCSYSYLGRLVDYLMDQV